MAYVPPYMYMYIFISRRLGNGWYIIMIDRRDILLLHRRDYHCSVGLMDLLRIRACQQVHVVKVVGSKYVSYIIY